MVIKGEFREGKDKRKGKEQNGKWSDWDRNG